MTPAQQKAKELFQKYENAIWENLTHTGDGVEEVLLAKKSALICVEEIIKSSPSLPILGDSGNFGEDIELSTKFWHEVKQAIKEL